LDASSKGDSLVLGHNWNIHILMGKIWDIAIRILESMEHMEHPNFD